MLWEQPYSQVSQYTPLGPIISNYTNNSTKAFFPLILAQQMQPAILGSPTTLDLFQALPSQAACIPLSHKHQPALTPPRSMYQTLTLVDRIVHSQVINVTEECPLKITIHTMLQTQSTWTCIDNSGQRFTQSSSTVYINVTRSIIRQGMVSQVYRSMVTMPAA